MNNYFDDFHAYNASIETQLCSLENSQKLKQLGVRQDSIYIHAGELGVIPSISFQKNPKVRSEAFEIASVKVFSAFTVAELCELLPEIIKNEDGISHRMCIVKKKNNWNIFYYDDEDDSYPLIWIDIDSNRLADALAKTLINLIERKLMVDAK